jgi:predicted permease
MLDILLKAASYIAVIILGFVLRRVGFFDEHAFPVLSKLVIKVTLPAALISSAVGREIDLSLLTIVLLGFGGGVVYMALGYFLNRKRGREQQAFEILNIPGYNIGTFALPFTQSFLGPMGVLTTSLFDVGNAFVCLGGAFGVASAVRDGKGLDLKRVGKALAVSVPFLAHIITVAMNLAHIPIPQFVADCAKIIAGANVFLAMLMIGVGFKTDMDFSQIGTIVRILAVRYGVATVLALCFFFLLPFSPEIRQALVILAFSPIGSAVPGFTAELKGDVGLSCTVNSLAIVISITIIVALLMVML